MGQEALGKAAAAVGDEGIGQLRLRTALSDGVSETGAVILRGHRLEDLVGHRSFEEVAALLWEEEWPGVMSAPALGAARLEAFQRFTPLFTATAGLMPAGLTVVEAQRFLLASLPHAAMTPLLLVGASGVAAAVATRLFAGLDPVAPDPALSHAADLLRMIRGRSARGGGTDDTERAGLDRYLVSMIDHGVNASTFTARVVVSTGAGLVAGAVAALGALQGPLHGGAPSLVLDMLDAIGEAGRAEAWITQALGRGERLMGFGSRAYQVRDPRADLLKAGLLALGPRVDERVAFAEAVERAALSVMAARRPDRSLHTNVEFYAALLLEAVGVPRDAFTPMFAAARSVGWAAHAREQERTGRMLRPTSRYVGPEPSDQQHQTLQRED